MNIRQFAVKLTSTIVNLGLGRHKNFRKLTKKLNSQDFLEKSTIANSKGQRSKVNLVNHHGKVLNSTKRSSIYICKQWYHPWLFILDKKKYLYIYISLVHFLIDFGLTFCELESNTYYLTILHLIFFCTPTYHPYRLVKFFPCPFSFYSSPRILKIKS